MDVCPEAPKQSLWPARSREPLLDFCPMILLVEIGSHAPFGVAER